MGRRAALPGAGPCLVCRVCSKLAARSRLPRNPKQRMAGAGHSPQSHRLRNLPPLDRRPPACPGVCRTGGAAWTGSALRAASGRNGTRRALRPRCLTRVSALACPGAPAAGAPRGETSRSSSKARARCQRGYSWSRRQRRPSWPRSRRGASQALVVQSRTWAPSTAAARRRRRSSRPRPRRARRPLRGMRPARLPGSTTSTISCS